jgi:hypothetical protein
LHLSAGIEVHVFLSPVICERLEDEQDPLVGGRPIINLTNRLTGHRMSLLIIVGVATAK